MVRVGKKVKWLRLVRESIGKGDKTSRESQEKVDFNLTKQNIPYLLKSAVFKLVPLFYSAFVVLCLYPFFFNTLLIEVQL